MQTLTAHAADANSDSPCSSSMSGFPTFGDDDEQPYCDEEHHLGSSVCYGESEEKEAGSALTAVERCTVQRKGMVGQPMQLLWDEEGMEVFDGTECGGSGSDGATGAGGHGKAKAKKGKWGHRGFQDLWGGNRYAFLFRSCMYACVYLANCCSACAWFASFGMNMC